ncbi:MAG: DUF4203 domain-containing protein [bacterium]
MYLPQDVINVIIGFSIIIGAIECFFGYRIFKVILGLVGFLLGGSLAATIGYAIFRHETVALLTGLIGGLIGGASMVVLFFVGIFLIGAFLGAVLGSVLFAAAGNNPGPAVLLILAVIAGLIALIFKKFMIIVSTGFGGAWSVVTGIAHFTGSIDLTNFNRIFSSAASRIYPILLCWLALGIFGVIVQYKSAPSKENIA